LPPGLWPLWWLNGGDRTVLAGAQAPIRKGSLIPAAPPDLVAALGAHDRKLFVVPSRQLIVVRTGRATPARDFNQQLWLRLSKALPRDPAGNSWHATVTSCIELSITESCKDVT
jgi:hypothetical protein